MMYSEGGVGTHEHRGSQTKSVKSSTVETSLFLWPGASEEELCWYEGLLDCEWPWVREMPAGGRDWMSSWACGT